MSAAPALGLSTLRALANRSAAGRSSRDVAPRRAAVSDRSSRLSARLLDERHVAAVQALHVRSFETLARESYAAAQVDSYARELRAAAYADELLTCRMYVVFDEAGEPVATAGWGDVPDRPDMARIRKVFVDPAHTRRGLASLLVADAERRARHAGRARFVLRANLNAVPLYRHLGYVEAEADEMATVDGMRLPVRWMRKTPSR